MHLQDVRMRFGRCMECARGNSGANENGAPLGAPLKGYSMRRDGTLSNLTPVARCDTRLPVRQRAVGALVDVAAARFGHFADLREQLEVQCRAEAGAVVGVGLAVLEVQALG
jgi:hypothetical protein